MYRRPSPERFGARLEMRSKVRTARGRGGQRDVLLTLQSVKGVV